jgi:hypothetical protein
LRGSSIEVHRDIAIQRRERWAKGTKVPWFHDSENGGSAPHRIACQLIISPTGSDTTRGRFGVSRIAVTASPRMSSPGKPEEFRVRKQVLRDWLAACRVDAAAQRRGVSVPVSRDIAAGKRPLSRIAAMILSSPPPQFGQCCMSMSKAQASAKTNLYSS